MLEVADPVEERAYRLDGVWVTDFVLPAYFAGATLGACAGEWCLSAGIGSADSTPPQPTIGCPLIAPAYAPGP